MDVIASDHMQLATPAGGEAQAPAFYAGLQGLEEQVKPADVAARGGCWFVLGGVRLRLGVEKEFMPAKKAHPAFLVDDLAGVSSRLVGAGFFAVRDEPLEGYDRCYVSDPFGNRIALMRRIS